MGRQDSCGLNGEDEVVLALAQLQMLAPLLLPRHPAHLHLSLLLQLADLSAFSRHAAKGWSMRVIREACYPPERDHSCALRSGAATAKFNAVQTRLACSAEKASSIHASKHSLCQKLHVTGPHTFSSCFSCCRALPATALREGPLPSTVKSPGQICARESALLPTIGSRMTTSGCSRYLHTQSPSEWNLPLSNKTTETHYPACALLTQTSLNNPQ